MGREFRLLRAPRAQASQYLAEDWSRRDWLVDRDPTLGTRAGTTIPLKSLGLWPTHPIDFIH